MGIETTDRHLGQIAADAGIGKARAGRAVYLQGLASKGRSIGDAVKATGLAASTIQRYARQFSINFSDYSPKAREAKEGAKRKPLPRITLKTERQAPGGDHEQEQVEGLI